MDRARFDAIIAAYGAEPRRWPQSERADAVAFIAREQIDLGEVRALDHALDGVREDMDIALLSARVLRQRQALRGAPPRGARWALAACALLGVAAGFGFGSTASSVEPSQVLGAALTAAFESGEEYGG